MRRVLCLVVGLLALLTVVDASASCVVSFDVQSNANGTSALVSGRGRVILRLRGGVDANLSARAEIVAGRLTDLALAGTASEAIVVKDASIVAGKQSIISVDSVLAKACGTNAHSLAETWAANIRDVLAGDYIALSEAKEIVVPFGEVRTIRYGGHFAGEMQATSDSPNVASLETDASAGVMRIRGVGVGTAALRLLAGECRHGMRIVCSKWAAQIPLSSFVEISGSHPRPDILMQAVRSSVRSGISAEPGAAIALGEPTVSGDGYTVRVTAKGDGYLSLSRVQEVAVKRIPAPGLKGPVVLVSNLPEKVTAPAVVMRERLNGWGAARALWHHINLGAEPLRMSVRIHNLSGVPARVHVTQASAGPSSDEIFAGHAATARFLADLFAGNGYVVNIPAEHSVNVAQLVLAHGEIASGLARFVPMDSDDLTVEVVFEAVASSNNNLLVTPASLQSGLSTSGYGFEGGRTIELTQATGSPWSFYSLGKEIDVNSRGNELAGSYGVLHTIHAKLDNPTDRAVRGELVMRPRGGVARGTFWVDGKVVETPVMHNSDEFVICSTTVQPQASHTFTVTTIPESGSHYPVLLTLRSSEKR